MSYPHEGSIHPWDNPEHYGPEHRHPIEQPIPGIYPEQHQTDYEYQQRLAAERHWREDEEARYREFEYHQQRQRATIHPLPDTPTSPASAADERQTQANAESPSSTGQESTESIDYTKVQDAYFTDLYIETLINGSSLADLHRISADESEYFPSQDEESERDRLAIRQSADAVEVKLLMRRLGISMEDFISIYNRFGSFIDQVVDRESAQPEQPIDDSSDNTGS